MATSAHAREGPAARPAISELLERAGVDWLAPVRAQLAAMQKGGRLPHALLLQGAEGAGQSELAQWLAARLLCDRSTAAPCGQCDDCNLIHAGTHPDLQFIGVDPDASTIRVEQIRGLSETLSLHSYRGGNKVAIIDPADAMNINAFNALLKTLEEPRDDTFLLLTTGRGDRLPPTIRSRCARLRLPLPATTAALTWLRTREPRAGWERLLALANGAPFRALEYAAAGLGELDRQMQAFLDEAQQRRPDIVRTAATWASDQPEVRILWLETWLAARLRASCAGSDVVNNNRLPCLPAAGDDRMIRAGFRLLDALREARQLAGGALNTQLLFEGLLVSFVDLTADRGAAGRESTKP